MGCLLKLVTGMLLGIGAFLWFAFLGQLYEKTMHPDMKNFSGSEFFLAGLILAFLTALTYLGFRSRNEQ